MTKKQSEPSDIKGKVEVTPNLMLEKMREAVRPKGKKGTWLRHLNNRQLAEVFHRLRLGQPAYRITKVAQEEWGVMPKSNVKSLTRAVTNFKAKMLGELQLEITNEKSPKRQADGKTLMRKAKARAEKVDGMGRLGWLIERQTERIQLLLEREKAESHMKFTDKSMEVLLDMLDRYLTLQVKLGVLDAKPPELNLNVKHRFDGLMQHTVQGGSAVVEAADKLLELCEKEALTMQLNEDGEYKLVKALPDGESTEAVSTD